MKKIINKIMSKFGYYPANDCKNALYAVMLESRRRKGQQIVVQLGSIRVLIIAKDSTVQG